jgi:hypothetical protein
MKKKTRPKKKVAPKRKATRKSRAKPARGRVTKPLQQGQAQEQGQVVQTPFMEEFAEKFADWPRSQDLENFPLLAAQFAEFSRVLFGTVPTLGKASELPGTPVDQETHDVLVAFLDELGWPLTDASIPNEDPEKSISHRTVRLWEVAVVLQGLLGQAARKTQPEDGGGGGFSGWPPITF